MDISSGRVKAKPWREASGRGVLHESTAPAKATTHLGSP